MEKKMLLFKICGVWNEVPVQFPEFMWLSPKGDIGTENSVRIDKPSSNSRYHRKKA